ncbi:hypothetical protein M2451_002838 [Dysgonomonas sp. PFB1-18]|uniref:hypothetical protein n=1 Tax=unclassified Dysgonomonas TaxID=2630389 RepID=UPI0024731F3C|nr:MULTISPECIES: hypothetical protein [unclassified Dysgonomonas]MDH6309947.1 hypothetical protein [Dysgonomonas sp. PF1-14]MDH6339857.1 hypothetical protein [Dysgonomonas sp. PF1-16]MDH6381505.1 hypothetical protein [Dysgonomonas sp. PFB1-18]MDH6398859.1 hypothetical protein [Dysgonomonas sp. PF1-23]
MYQSNDEHIQEDVAKLQFRDVGQCIDRFSQVNYQTALSVNTNAKPTSEDIALLRSKILDIIRNNPPLKSVQRYMYDGREDYLWYSDFYDDITKEVYHKYRTFTKPQNEITPANYAEELAKIDLPYFRELVDLISLERLLANYPNKEAKPKEKIEVSRPIDTPKVDKQEISIEEQVVTENAKSKSTTKNKQQFKKRSYEPKLNNEQYKLLAEYIEKIRLFRRPVKAAQLRKLLSGKLPEALQVTNQKSLVYLFDELSAKGYIKGTWMSVAAGNKDFISFRSEGNIRRYGSEIHYIPIGQMMNDRKRSKREFVQGLDDIDELIELIEENREE